MKFITVRDLATKNKKTRQIISAGDSVLTLNGKPIAYMIPVNEDNFEYVVNEAVQIRASAAVESMRKKSRSSRADRGGRQKDSGGVQEKTR